MARGLASVVAAVAAVAGVVASEAAGSYQDPGA